MELLELRAKLETLLAEELGRFSDTGEIALWVNPPQARPGNTVNGIECVIRRVATGKVIPMSAGQKLFEFRYAIELINFDSKKSLLKAKELIEAHLPIERDSDYRAPSSTALETCRCYIKTLRVVNPRS